MKTGARQPLRARLTEGGRVVIPAEYRRALDLRIGDEVLLSLEDGEIRLFTVREAVRRAQVAVRRYVPEGRSLADELAAERRRESAHEQVGAGRVRLARASECRTGA